MLVLAAAMIAAEGSAAGQKRPCPASEVGVQDARFSPGQVWSYETRLQDSGSSVTVLRVDRSSKIGIIVHVRADGLGMRNPRGEAVPVIMHMPFSRDAMLLSVTKLLRTSPVLPTMEGLRQWEADCGGVYTISVRDAVDVAEKTFKGTRVR